MHLASFLQDLAMIMIVAGLVTIIFHRLKQPVVLGYIVAGVILGPHTPPFLLIHNEATIKILAELGVIFLMFSLGLEFSIRKLFRVGVVALIAAVAEIIFMILIGYEIGQFFHWNVIDSIFLGTMLAISSTTIIIKALNELRMKKENFAQMIFGILIIEDILAIGILALLSSIAVTQSLNLTDVASTIGKLLVFLVSSLVIGILIIPKLFSYVDKIRNKEMFLIMILALCFGFSLLVIKLGYSVALGAFLIGAIMAESEKIKKIEKLTNPLTNMFSAIFFVSIGLLVNPNILIDYLIPILIITIAVVVGKVFICSAAVFLGGHTGKTSMRVGMGLAQIGEFSFIIASLGINLKVMSPFLYPVIVAVSVVTTFLTPYLIKNADALANLLAKKTPNSVAQVFNTYTDWLQNITPTEETHMLAMQSIKKGMLQIFINLMLIIAIFISGSFILPYFTSKLLVIDVRISKTILFGLLLLISIPFLIAIYQKVKAFSTMLAEVTFKKHNKAHDKIILQKIIAEIIPMSCLLGICLIILALSASILPPLEWLMFLILIVIALTTVLWRWFIKLHTRLQTDLIETLEKKNKP